MVDGRCSKADSKAVGLCSATSLRMLVGLASHPDLSILKDLFLPDGHGLLDAVHNVVTGFKGFLAVGRSHSNHQADVLYLQMSDAVDDGHILDGPLGGDFLAYPLQLLKGHGLIGFVFQVKDGLILGGAPGGAQEGYTAPLLSLRTEAVMGWGSSTLRVISIILGLRLRVV